MSSEEALEANIASLSRYKKLFKEAKELVLSKKYEKAVIVASFKRHFFIFSI